MSRLLRRDLVCPRDERPVHELPGRDAADPRNYHAHDAKGADLCPGRCEPAQPIETTTAILFLLSDGETPAEILERHPNLTLDDVARAAEVALSIMERARAPAPHLPGCCQSCGEQITGRQRHVKVTQHGRGASAEPDLFHAKCSGAFRSGWGA